jgi:RNA polymerase sigma factor (sigma-70 family)
MNSSGKELLKTEDIEELSRTLREIEPHVEKMWQQYSPDSVANDYVKESIVSHLRFVLLKDPTNLSRLVADNRLMFWCERYIRNMLVHRDTISYRSKRAEVALEECKDESAFVNYEFEHKLDESIYLKDVLVQALKSFPLQDTKMLVLMAEGLSAHEISEALNVSETYVRSRVNRARTVLRQRLVAEDAT